MVLILTDLGLQCDYTWFSLILIIGHLAKIQFDTAHLSMLVFRES